MKTWILVLLAVIMVGGGAYWWVQQNPSAQAPIYQEQTNSPATTQIEQQTNTKPIQNPTTLGTKDYKGAWFKVTYPANFTAKQEGQDEASFTSTDGSAQFYVYSPRWSGDPVSYLNALPTETVESDTSTPNVTSSTNQYGTTYYKKIIRYVTFVAKDGSYKRSFISTIAGYVTSPESADYSSKTHFVFGIKYKDQATYDTYLNQYLAFKKSLVQYAD